MIFALGNKNPLPKINPLPRTAERQASHGRTDRAHSRSAVTNETDETKTNAHQNRSGSALRSRQHRNQKLSAKPSAAPTDACAATQPRHNGESPQATQASRAEPDKVFHPHPKRQKLNKLKP